MLEEIHNADKIHASLYGIADAPEVMAALRKARDRGVEIRIVVDYATGDRPFVYPDTAAFLEEFGARMVRAESEHVQIDTRATLPEPALPEQRESSTFALTISPRHSDLRSGMPLQRSTRLVCMPAPLTVCFSSSEKRFPISPGFRL